MQANSTQGQNSHNSFVVNENGISAWWLCKVKADFGNRLPGFKSQPYHILPV